MYLKILHFTFLVLVATTMFSQAPKLVKTETQIYLADQSSWSPRQREFFEYSGDLMSRHQRRIWYQLPDKFVDKEIFEYEYDEADRLILKLEYDFTSSDAVVQNFYWDEYYYNEDGCLIAQKDSVSSIHGIYDQRYYEFIPGEDCQPLVELNYTLKPTGDTVFYKTNKAYDEVGQLILDTLFWKRDGEWKELENYLYHYNESGRMIEKQKNSVFSFNSQTEYEQWMYDGNDNLVFYIRWREKPSNPFQVIYKDSIILEYDDRKRVEKKWIYSTRFTTENPTQFFTYDYYCQDILKESTRDFLPYVYRTIYEYDTGFDDDCAEDIEDSSISIHPNPSNGFVQLRSDLLGAENALIRVFDVSGRELFKQNFRELKNFIELDLSFLQAGMYFISLEIGDRIETQKIIIH